MLSEDAYRERKWGQFPFLRTVLEGERLSPHLPSTADTFSDSVSRLVEIAALACDHSDKLRDAAHSAGWAAMHRDLEVLRGELRNASTVLNDIELASGCGTSSNRIGDIIASAR